jgi:hypothetical protein
MKKNCILYVLIIPILFLSACKEELTPVEGVTLDLNALTLVEGQTQQLTATVHPPDADNRKVSWNSSDPNVAVVSNSGSVSAGTAGTAVITVTTEEGAKTAVCTVTVSKNVVEVVGITLDKNEIILREGGSGRLSATIAPAAATNKNVTWSSSNDRVATVDHTGLVTAREAGAATVTATSEDGAKTAVCPVVVFSAADGISLLDRAVDPQSSVLYYRLHDAQFERMVNISFIDELQSVTKQVYGKFKDDFDFIFFLIDMPHDSDWEKYPNSGNRFGFAGVNIQVSNAVQGTGRPIYSDAGQWGSAGKLKSVTFFPYDNAIIWGPSLHELMHNWGAFIVPTYGSNGELYTGHWGVSNAGGQLGGFKYSRKVEENTAGIRGTTLYQASFYPDTHPDGSFKRGFTEMANAGQDWAVYSDIEMYLMGLKSAQELRDAKFRLDIYTGCSVEHDLHAFWSQGYFRATGITSYTIDDIIRLNGERIPHASVSQKNFKLLTVVLSPEDVSQSRYAEIIKSVLWFSGKEGDNSYPERDAPNFIEATAGRSTIVATGLRNSLK